MSMDVHRKQLSHRLWVWIITILFWLLVQIILPKITGAMMAQSSLTLQEVLSRAEHQSVYKYQADADNKIAHSKWAFFKTNLSPGVNLDMLIPNLIKTSQEITQPDGSIAFQSVSQNNSSIQLGLQQNIVATGGTLFIRTQLQRFDDFSLDTKQYNGIPFRIGFTQPLFGYNGLKWDNKIEPLVLKEADRKYVIDLENIHLRATSVYFQLLTAQVNEDIAMTNKEVNNKLLDIAKERFALGKISRNELLQLELEYRSAVKNLSIAQYDVEYARGALYTFLGQNTVENIQLEIPLPMDQTIKIDRQRAFKYAQDNRPEVIAFDRSIKEADRDINRTKVAYGVRADLFASFGFARGAQTVSEVYTSPISEQQVQLNLSIPILDWGRRKSAVGIAEARKELLIQQIVQDLLDFDNEIHQVIGRWEQLQKEVMFQKEIQSVAADRFEISRQRYVLGDISITDLTIAQREKNQAQRDYIVTLQSYWETYYLIRKLTGYDFKNNIAIQTKHTLN